MNFAAVFGLILQLSIPVVLTVEEGIGEAKAGVEKKTIAADMLAGATASALGVLTGQNAIYAQLASKVAAFAIDAAVAFTRRTGDYQKATAAAHAAAGTVPTAIPAQAAA